MIKVHFTISSESDHDDNDDENYNENMETVVCRCFSKQVFLKSSQISQENNCVGVSFYRYTNADLKISLFVLIDTKIIP